MLYGHTVKRHVIALHHEARLAGVRTIARGARDPVVRAPKPDVIPDHVPGCDPYHDLGAHFFLMWVVGAANPCEHVMQETRILAVALIGLAAPLQEHIAAVSASLQYEPSHTHAIDTGSHAYKSVPRHGAQRGQAQS
jgi:hypothetical protein